MRTKRTMLALIAILAIVLLGGTAWANGSGEQGSASAPVEVSWWSIWDPAATAGNGKYFKDAVDAFNAANPTIKVTMYGQGGYDGVAEKLEAAIIAKNQPVLAQTEVSFLARFGVKAADLSKYLSKKVIDNYIPGLLASAYDKGVLKAVPINQSTPIMYLNTELLKKAGLDPNGPKTWDDVAAWSEKIHAMDPNLYGFTMYWDTDAWYWESAVYSYGGDIVKDNKVTFNNDTGIKIVKLCQDMIKKGTMLNAYGGQEGGSGFMYGRFKEGKVAMMVDSIGGIASLCKDPNYPFKVNTCFQPAGTKNSVVSGGANMIMMVDSTEAQKKAAGKLLEFLAQDKYAAGFSMQSGYFPTTLSALKTPEYIQLFKDFPQYKVAIDQMQYIHQRPWHKNWREMYMTIMESLEASLIDPNSDAAALMAAAADRCQKIIDANK
jgi:sn-glycerol 3-phosphate transport system substrate-binding protein